MNIDRDHTKHLVLMMTYSCNLQCVYCYERHQKGKEMNADMAISIIQREFEHASKEENINRIEIIFMGGEPLLHWDAICKIVEYIEQRKYWPLPYHFFAATNATLLDDSKKEWIEPRKNHFILGVSVDGNPQMHDTNRSGSSKMVDLRYFANTWPQQAPKMTVSHDTLPTLAEGVKYLHGIGFHKIQANLAMGQTDWGKDDLIIYARQLNLLIDYYMDNPSFNRCALLNIDILTSLNLERKNRKYCGCGEIMKCVDVDGTEYPCQMFAPITLSEEQLRYASDIDFRDHSFFQNNICDKCILNVKCPRCYGMSYKSSNDVRYREPFLCKAFKIQFLSNVILMQKRIDAGLEDENKDKLLSVINYIQKYLFKNY